MTEVLDLSYLAKGKTKVTLRFLWRGNVIFEETVPDYYDKFEPEEKAKDFIKFVKWTFGSCNYKLEWDWKAPDRIDIWVEEDDNDNQQ